MIRTRISQRYRDIHELVFIKSHLIYRLMGKKQKKVVQAVDSEQEGSSAVARRGKKQLDFFCKCGRGYLSASAVYTHIKNDHPNEKEKFRKGIINPKKAAQGPYTSLRFKDIFYDKQEADLMCMADNTCKNIFDYLKKLEEKTNQKTIFLLDENAIDSCEELDDDEDIEIELRHGSRDQDIQRKVEALKDRYDISYINPIIKDATEFELFKLNKFKLAMIRELTKFFNPEFASKVQLELEIIAAKNRISERDVNNQLTAVENDLWADKKAIVGIMEYYYKTWGELRSKEYKNNTR